MLKDKTPKQANREEHYDISLVEKTTKQVLATQSVCISVPPGVSGRDVESFLKEHGKRLVDIVIRRTKGPKA